MNKPLLLLQLRPEDSTSDNEYASMLKYSGLHSDQLVRKRIEKSGIPEDLDLDEFCGIISGGSPFDISKSDNEKSRIQKRIESGFNQLFERIIERDFPFLGACSGNGLLGSYLGSSVSTRFAESVSCVDVMLTDAGREDPLLWDFPAQFPVLLGHKEACDDVPEDATLLLKGNTCVVQMFRVKQNIYATQFHPEGDREGFALRIQVYKHHGYFKPEEADVLIRRLNNVYTPFAHRILYRFARRCLES